MIAWHFTRGNKLLSGKPVPPPGVTLVHEGPVEMCRSGLHASRRVVDALGFAPGHTAHLVRCEDVEHHDENKLVCRRRTVIASLNARVVLDTFARQCALRCVHLWHAPSDLVVYLRTGDGRFRRVWRIDALSLPPRFACLSSWYALSRLKVTLRANGAFREATRSVPDIDRELNALLEGQLKARMEL